MKALRGLFKKTPNQELVFYADNGTILPLQVTSRQDAYAYLAQQGSKYILDLHYPIIKRCKSGSYNWAIIFDCYGQKKGFISRGRALHWLSIHGYRHLYHGGIKKDC